MAKLHLTYTKLPDDGWDSLLVMGADALKSPEVDQVVLPLRAYMATVATPIAQMKEMVNENTLRFTLVFNSVDEATRYRDAKEDVSNPVVAAFKQFLVDRYDTMKHYQPTLEYSIES